MRVCVCVCVCALPCTNGTCVVCMLWPVSGLFAGVGGSLETILSLGPYFIVTVINNRFCFCIRVEQFAICENFI